ncbi:hypothetical protein CA85_48940 [Allorhodopirellula solitaria]|uniref:Uncharacterized protein n=1 Tax=Allorhodopirellula solitaria TaxID=2527987 RepID=A0A5C5WZM3_9BACT|nr:hypothetical protein CA85_48940 [Allorhodopirellula solitaria]
MLHLATHGYFLEDRPDIDQDSQGTSGFQSLRQEAGGAWSVAGIENPLLRSSLALAGVNTWLVARLVPADAEDGILTAEDVTGMDLTDTDPRRGPSILFVHQIADSVAANLANLPNSALVTGNPTVFQLLAPRPRRSQPRGIEFGLVVIGLCQTDDKPSGLPGAQSHFWSRRDASSARCSGLPAARRNTRPNLSTMSHQPWVSKPMRVRMGCRCSGIDPTLSLRI